MKLLTVPTFLVAGLALSAGMVSGGYLAIQPGQWQEAWVQNLKAFGPALSAMASFLAASAAIGIALVSERNTNERQQAEWLEREKSRSKDKLSEVLKNLSFIGSHSKMRIIHLNEIEDTLLRQDTQYLRSYYRIGDISFFYYDIISKSDIVTQELVLKFIQCEIEFHKTIKLVKDSNLNPPIKIEKFRPLFQSISNNFSQIQIEVGILEQKYNDPTNHVGVKLPVVSSCN